MSAVSGRQRRVTAGRRMSDLVGKAAEDDEAFWSHDVWGEDDSGNDSFHESDEDSEQRKDQFDSDFNDSESDNEAEEMAAGQAEEAELENEERSARRKKGYVDIAKAGRDLLQKKKGTSRKRKKDLMGDGINAGLVLNLPGQAATAAPLAQPQAAGAIAPSEPVNKVKAKPVSPAKPAATLASTRSLRSTQALARRQLRAATRDNKNANAQKMARHTQPTKKPQRRFTQEQLLLEAATVTEPENERWLLGRKRIQDLEEIHAKTAGTNREVRGKILHKFHSRRGCFNTLTFPEMDAVPAILATKQSPPKRPKKNVCVITGKPARYRDPKTKMPYHDLAAFKELRRRLQAGEPLDRTKKKLNPADGGLSVVKNGGGTTTAATSVSAASSNGTDTTKQAPKVGQVVKAEMKKATAVEPSMPMEAAPQPVVATAPKSSSTVAPKSDPLPASSNAKVASQSAVATASGNVAPKPVPLPVPSNGVVPASQGNNGSNTKTAILKPAVAAKPEATASKVTKPNAAKQQPTQNPARTSNVPKAPEAARAEAPPAARAKSPPKQVASKPTEPPSVRTNLKQPPRKTASPTTATMIHNALAAYAKLHDTNQE